MRLTRIRQWLGKGDAHGGETGGGKSSSRQAKRDATSGRRPGPERRRMFVEPLESRQLLATFGTDWTYLPTSGKSLTWLCPADGFCYSHQGIAGSGTATYKFFADSSTQYDVTYYKGKDSVPESHHFGVEGDHIRLVTFPIRANSKFEGSVYNPAAPQLRVLSQWDENPTDQMLGPFLYSVHLENRFDLQFTPALPGDLQVEYRWEDQGTWKPGKSFERNIASFDKGNTRLDVRILDAEGRLIHEYPWAADVFTRYDLGTTITWHDGHGNSILAEDARFLTDVDAGAWTAEVRPNYLPLAEAYKNHEFALGFVRTDSPDVVRFSKVLDVQSFSAAKITATASDLNVGSLFDDLVPGVEGVDYFARVIARPAKTNLAYSKPFSSREPVLTSRLPEWMETDPGDVEYVETDLFGTPRYAYVIDVSAFEFEQNLPTTADTPYGLFDGRKTFLSSELDVKVTALPTFRVNPKVTAEEWRLTAVLLGQPLTSASGRLLKDSEVHVSGFVEPKALGLDGSGIVITSDPVVFAHNRVIAKSTAKGIDFSVPIVTAGAVTLDGQLKIDGGYEILAKDVSLEAGVQLKYTNGSLVLDREGTFARLNVVGSGTLEVDGKGSLGIRPGFTPPPGTPEEQKKKIDEFRLELLQLVAKGLGKVNVDGAVQANFYGPFSDISSDFDDTSVVISGSLDLKYNTCLGGDSVREFFGLEECTSASQMKSLGKIAFGPKVILGPEPPPADPSDPASYDSSGTGISGGSSGGGAGEGGGTNPAGPVVGSLRFRQPYDAELRRVDYRLAARTSLPAVPLEQYFLRLYAVGPGDEVLLDEIDLATLAYSGVGDLTATHDAQATLAPDALQDDRSYQLEYRLIAAPTASPGGVSVQLLDFSTLNDGPAMRLAIAEQPLNGDRIVFGEQTDGGRSVAVAIHNDADFPLRIDSVEVLGDRFTLVDAAPWSKHVLSQRPAVYVVQLPDVSRAAAGTLRIRTNDPLHPIRDIALEFSGGGALHNSGPRVTQVALASTAGTANTVSIFSANSTLTDRTDLDQVRVTFDRPVRVYEDSLHLFAPNQTEASVSQFEYDPATNTGIWTLKAPLAAGAVEFLLLDTIADLYGNRLDGELTSPAAATGDGVSGGPLKVSVQIGNATALAGPPNLAPLPHRAIDESGGLAISAQATPTVPGETITYRLAAGPAHATIDSSSGAIAWLPPERFSAGRYHFIVEARQTASPGQAAYRAFDVDLRKSNAAPRLNPLEPQTIRQRETLALTVQATDADFPVQSLTYQLLDGAPAGATIEPATGRFRWVTDSNTPPGRYAIPIAVSDNGGPPQMTTTVLTVDVLARNTPPQFGPLPTPTAIEHQPVAFTVAAFDVDSPPPTFRLQHAPEGMSIDATSGAVSWTPSELDGGIKQRVVVELIDGRDPTVTSRAEIVVDVAEVNNAPTLQLPSAESLTVEIGTPIEFSIGVSDGDIPERYKEFFLRERPDNTATLGLTSGQFRWLSTQPGEYSFTVELMDYHFGNTVSTTETFTITILPDETPPEIQLQVPTPSSAPTAIIGVVDRAEVEGVRVRFVDPPTDFVTIEFAPHVTTVDSQTLRDILGAEFEPGEYLLEVEAEDEFGNISTAQASFLIDHTPPAPASLTLAAESDSAPVGDEQTSFTAVTVVAQTEPFGQVILYPQHLNAIGTEYRGQADELGVARIENVLLPVLGRNRFDVETWDAAGNVALSRYSVTRTSSDGSYGPNAIGYLATAVAPGFVDIAATGESMSAATSDSTLELTAADLPGFSFSLYGQTYDSIFLSHNGIVSFGEASWESPGGGLSWLPSIAPFWTNSSLSDPADDVFWQWTPSAGGGELVVQWNVTAQAYLAADDDYLETSLRFQAVLNTVEQSITFHYDTLFPGDASDLQFSESVFLSPGGPEIAGLPLVLADRSAPHDLVTNHASVKITATPEPLSPFLTANWTDATDWDDEFVPAFPLIGAAADISGLATLDLELVGVPSSTISLLTQLEYGHQFTVELESLETLLGFTLPDGNLTFRLTAIDHAGHQFTLDLPIQLDRLPPALLELQLSSKTDGAVRGDWVTDLRYVILQGVTEPGATVDIEGPNGGAGFIEIDELGRFITQDLDLDIGDNSIEIRIVDAAGNETVETVTISREALLGTERDTYGYRAAEMDDSFQDISATGTRINFAAGASTAELSANDLDAFLFYFYGEQYHSLHVGRDGILLFGALTEDPEGPFYLEYSPENAAIVPLGDAFSLDATADSGVFWQLDEHLGGTRLTVQWNEVAFRDGNGEPVTFQVVLNTVDGTIEFHYENLVTGDEYDEGWESAVGIKAAGDQDDSGNVIELSSYGSPSDFVGSGKSVRFTRDVIAAGSPRAMVSANATASGSQIIDSFIVQFDRSMDPASFSLEEDLVDFTGPSGDLTSAVTGFRWLDSLTLKIEIEPQTADGVYQLRLRPSILSQSFNVPLDQDGDGVPGEAQQDQVTLSASLQACVHSLTSGYSACVTDSEPILLSREQPGVFVIHADSDDGSVAIDLGERTLRVDRYVVTGNNALFVSVNGIISLGAPVKAFDPSDMTDLTAQLAIAPLWSDWLASSYDDDIVLGWIEENRGGGLPDRLIIQWQVYNFTYSTGFDSSTALFQAIFELDSPGTSPIIFQYPRLELLETFGGNPYPATIGIHGQRLAETPFVISHPGASSPWVQSGQALLITLERPRAQLGSVAADVTGPVTEIPLHFNHPVTGLGLDDFQWRRGEIALSLDGADLSGSGASWTLTLPAASQTTGSYSLTLLNDGSITSLTGGPLVGEETVRWRNHGVNQAPHSIQLSATEITAYQPVAAVGTLTVSDLNDGQVHSWEVSDPRFVVEAGVLRLAPGTAIDFTAERSIPIELTVTDSGFPPLSYSQTFDLTVLDAPRVPRAVQLLGAQVRERISGATVGQLLTSGDDLAELIEFTITDPRFTIADGILQLTEDSFLSLEGLTAIQVDIVAHRTDANNLSQTYTVVFQLSANPFPWNNQPRPLDTNTDGVVTPIDALRIINELNQPRVTVNSKLPGARPAATDLAYFDVNADGFAAPIDVLIIINWLNNASAGGGEGEAPTATPATTQPVLHRNLLIPGTQSFSDSTANETKATLRAGDIADDAGAAIWSIPAETQRAESAYRPDGVFEAWDDAEFDELLSQVLDESPEVAWLVE